ncbi:MAG: hypothetical protein ACON4H_17035 [Rubripirellula sp.]
MLTQNTIVRYIVSPAFLFSFLFIGLTTNETQAETWTSLRGTFSVEAKMLGLWGDSVILQMDDGRRVSVNQLDLKAESRIQATKIAERLAEERMARIDELKVQATELAAPAPNPLPEPPAAPAYTAPKADVSAAEFLEQVDSALMSGHLIVLYDALPPSYRQNVDEMIKLSASSLDPNTFGMVTGVLHQIGDVIVTRQRWLLSSPRIASLGPAEQDFFSGPFLNLAGLLRKGFDPAAMQLQTLQSGDFREWLEERDQVIAPYLAQLIDQLGAASLQQSVVESEENGVAVVNTTTGGVSMKSAYVQVEGFWVPQSLADTWAEDFEQMKQSSTQVDTATIASATLFLQPAQLVLNQLANAEDASSFHQQLEAVFAPAEAMLSTFAGSFAASLAGSQTGAGNNQGGYGDYEMDMEGEYEMEMEMDMDMEMEMEQDMELEMRGLDFGSSPR